MITDFEELSIYQQARELAKTIYSLTRTGDFRFDTRFVQQIRAAVGSISDNIAEGFERQGHKEFIQYLYIAKGSCGELRSQINRALDIGFIPAETHQQLYTAAKRRSIGILHLIQTIKQFDSKGSKYQP